MRDEVCGYHTCAYLLCAASEMVRTVILLKMALIDLIGDV